jgi:hypothetical protein
LHVIGRGGQNTDGQNCCQQSECHSTLKLRCDPGKQRYRSKLKVV